MENEYLIVSESKVRPYSSGPVPAKEETRYAVHERFVTSSADDAEAWAEAWLHRRDMTGTYHVVLVTATLKATKPLRIER